MDSLMITLLKNGSSNKLAQIVNKLQLPKAPATTLNDPHPNPPQNEAINLIRLRMKLLT